MMEDNIRKRMCVYIYIYIYIYIHTHIHIHTYIHIYDCVTFLYNRNSQNTGNQL